MLKETIAGDGTLIIKISLKAKVASALIPLLTIKHLLKMRVDLILITKERGGRKIRKKVTIAVLSLKIVIK